MRTRARVRTPRRDLLAGLAVALLAGMGACGPGGGTGIDAAEREAERVRDLYLDLMKKTLTDLIYEDDPDLRAMLAGDLSFWRDALRGTWHGYPERAHTMVGLARLDNVERLMEDVLAQGVPGDFIEAGAWRGGATIFMRAVLEAHGVRDRTVWVADSFQGLPPPNPEEFPADEGLDLSGVPELAASREQVVRNFERYGLLDDQVRFLEGWFSETLPGAPIETLAVLRVDADLYESTMDALRPLYPKVAPGGYVIIDDYGSIAACKKAVEDFRAEHGIEAPLHEIDWTGVYWQKP